MVLNELLLDLWAHSIEWIVSTCKLTGETVKSFDNHSLNLCSSLWVVDTWSKWESIQVSSNSDSCAPDHSCLIWWEIWGIQSIIWILSGVEVTSGVVSMILHDDWIEDVSELSVRVLGTGIDTNSRIDVLTSRVNGVSEWESILIFATFVFIPNLLCKVLAQKRFGSRWEHWETIQIIRASKVRSTLYGFAISGEFLVDLLVNLLLHHRGWWLLLLYSKILTLATKLRSEGSWLIGPWSWLHILDWGWSDWSSRFLGS